jgi:hypothetical protein
MSSRRRRRCLLAHRFSPAPPDPLVAEPPEPPAPPDEPVGPPDAPLLVAVAPIPTLPDCAEELDPVTPLVALVVAPSSIPEQAMTTRAQKNTA